MEESAILPSFLFVSFSVKSKQILNIQTEQPHSEEGSVKAQKQSLFKI